MLGCRDVARVDFRLDSHDNNTPYILEINPLPGLNPRISDLVIEARAEGASYAELINSILLHGAARHGLLPKGIQLNWPAVRLPMRRTAGRCADHLSSTLAGRPLREVCNDLLTARKSVFKVIKGRKSSPLCGPALSKIASFENSRARGYINLSYPQVDASDWSTVQPHFDALLAAPLGCDDVPGWLRQWSALAAVLEEADAQVYREVTENTADAAAEQRFKHFMGEIKPQAQVAGQALKQKLLAVPGYQPDDDAALLLRRFRNEADIFRAENVALESKLALLSNQYNKRVGAMTIEWQGREETLPQATSRLEEPDRAEREAIWRRIMQRYLADRGALNDLYMQMLPLRRQSAATQASPITGTIAGSNWPASTIAPTTPSPSTTPSSTPWCRWRRSSTSNWPAGWGWTACAPGTPRPTHGQPLRPFADAAELEAGGQRIFEQVDPVLAQHFTAMRDGYLDLASRPNKAPGGYCNGFPVSGKPYIFMNAVGTNDDVTTLLHEGGHAFHFMESLRQPLVWNHHAQMEFCEVASMSMELLSAPYLASDRGGFYTEADARRAYADQLRRIVLFLPYMAVVDRFQHWVYAEAPADVTPADLDRTWSRAVGPLPARRRLQRPAVEKETGWHRKRHIFEAPFYYIEYGLAQLGALQVWRNALADQAGLWPVTAPRWLGVHQVPAGAVRRRRRPLCLRPPTVGELMALVGERLTGGLTGVGLALVPRSTIWLLLSRPTAPPG